MSLNMLIAQQTVCMHVCGRVRLCVFDKRQEENITVKMTIVATEMSTWFSK